MTSERNSESIRANIEQKELSEAKVKEDARKELVALIEEILKRGKVEIAACFYEGEVLPDGTPNRKHLAETVSLGASKQFEDLSLYHAARSSGIECGRNYSRDDYNFLLYDMKPLEYSSANLDRRVQDKDHSILRFETMGHSPSDGREMKNTVDILVPNDLAQKIGVLIQKGPNDIPIWLRNLLFTKIFNRARPGYRVGENEIRYAMPCDNYPITARGTIGIQIEDAVRKQAEEEDFKMTLRFFKHIQSKKKIES